MTQLPPVDISRDYQVAFERYFRDAPEKRFQKYDVILHGDGPQSIVYFVRSGFIKAYSINTQGNYGLYVIKGTGDVLPLTALLVNEEARLYYEAMSEVAVRGVPRQQFEADLRHDISLCFSTLRCSLAQARETARRIHNLEITDSRLRVISRLLFLHRQFGTIGGAEQSPIALPINHQDLADSLNLTRDTANRVVRQLAAEGLLAKSRSRVSLLDIPRLQAATEGL